MFLALQKPKQETDSAHIAPATLTELCPERAVPSLQSDSSQPFGVSPPSLCVIFKAEHPPNYQICFRPAHGETSFQYLQVVRVCISAASPTLLFSPSLFSLVELPGFSGWLRPFAYCLCGALVSRRFVWEVDAQTGQRSLSSNKPKTSPCPVSSSFSLRLVYPTQQRSLFARRIAALPLLHSIALFAVSRLRGV